LNLIVVLKFAGKGKQKPQITMPLKIILQNLTLR